MTDNRKNSELGIQRIEVFEVYKSGRGYIVRVNDDMYQMSGTDATSPRGVNMYAGPWEEWEDSSVVHRGELDEVPVEVVRGFLLCNLVYEVWEDASFENLLLHLKGETNATEDQD